MSSSVAEDGGGADVVGETEDVFEFSTLAAQAGFCRAGNPYSLSARGKSLCMVSGFEFNSFEEYEASKYIYRRLKSPNTDDFAHAVASLESAEAGVSTSAGMGAVVSAVLGLLNAGDTVFVHTDVYGGTFDFFNVDVRRFGINVNFVDVLEVANVEASLSDFAAKGGDPRTVLVFLESITNPTIRVADLTAIGGVVKKYGSLMIVDNTFGTPLREKPLLKGADLVVHSASKFLGGHSDLVAGAVVGPSKFVQKVEKVATRWGLTASPFDAWLCVRSIRTLEVRLERSWATAEKLVKRLSASDLVLRINSALKCAVFSFEVHGGWKGVGRAINAFHLIKIASSLGGVTTTVSHPASSSHKILPPEERQRLGIVDGLLRISIGLEDVDDIWADLQRGLSAAKSENVNGIAKKLQPSLNGQ